MERYDYEYSNITVATIAYNLRHYESNCILDMQLIYKSILPSNLTRLELIYSFNIFVYVTVKDVN